MYPVVGAYRIRPPDATDGGEYMSCVRPLDGDVGEGVCFCALPIRLKTIEPIHFQRYPDGRKTRTAEVGRLETYAVPPDTQWSADGLTDKNGKSLRICGRKNMIIF